MSFDFGWSRSLSLHSDLPALMDVADLVFVNELEAPLYARADALDDAYPILRGRQCTVIVKLGSVGSRWLRAGPEGDMVMPAPRVEPVDTTGAGDAFNAGFLSAWLRGSVPAACLATGNTVGAASTRAAGGLDALPRISALPMLLRPTAARRTQRPGPSRGRKTSRVSAPGPARSRARASKRSRRTS